MEETVTSLLSLDRRVRYVAIIDKDGNVIEQKFSSTVKPLLSPEGIKDFARDVMVRRVMRAKWDPHFGKALCTVALRDKLTVATLYLRDKTVLLTLERGAPLRIIDGVREILGLT